MKVRPSTWSGSTSPLATSHTTRAAIVSVLPEPAPATTSSGRGHRLDDRGLLVGGRRHLERGRDVEGDLRRSAGGVSRGHSASPSGWTGHDDRTGHVSHALPCAAPKSAAPIPSAVALDEVARPARVVAARERRLVEDAGLSPDRPPLPMKTSAAPGAAVAELREAALLDGHLVGAELAVLGELGPRRLATCPS